MKNPSDYVDQIAFLPGEHDAQGDALYGPLRLSDGSKYKSRLLNAIAALSRQNGSYLTRDDELFGRLWGHLELPRLAADFSLEQDQAMHEALEVLTESGIAYRLLEFTDLDDDDERGFQITTDITQREAIDALENHCNEKERKNERRN